MHRVAFLDDLIEREPSERLMGELQGLLSAGC